MRRRERRVKVHNLLFLYVATTIIVTVVSFSKYVTTVSTDNIAKIAVMANSVSFDLDISKDAYPGYEAVYPIVLVNSEDGKICEVSQKYSMQIQREEIENIPLEFDLYKDEYCTEIIDKDENGYYTSDDFILNGTQEETDTYYLKITWPKEYNDEYYAFEIGYFSIDIVSTQID